MNFKKLSFLICSLFIVFPSVVFAETWYVIQGANSDWQGEWIYQSGEKPGPEYFFMSLNNVKSGETMTGHATVYYSGNHVSASSLNSDGNTCDYSGDIVDNKISNGKEICPTGSYLWLVTITPDKKSGK